MAGWRSNGFPMAPLAAAGFVALVLIAGVMAAAFTAGGIAKLEFYNNLRKIADVEEDGVTIRYPAGFVHVPQVDAEFVFLWGQFLLGSRAVGLLHGGELLVLDRLAL